MGSQDNVEFKDLEDCLDFLSAYKGSDVIKATTDFEKYLNIVAVYHAKNGLSVEQLELLISFVFLKNLKSKTIKLLIQCLIPKRLVPKNLVSNVAFYVLSCHDDLAPYITINLLKWLIAILEYELTDVSAVDDFYRLFYFMLRNQNIEIQKYVIRLIYMLTHPEDVTEEKIECLSKLQFKYGKTKESKALFSLFKCYQPARVPVSVPVMELFDIPQYLPSEVMKDALMMAQKRNSDGSEVSSTVSSENRVPFIKNLKADDLKPKYSKNIIQTPVYGDNINNRKEATEIESIAEIEACRDNLLLPSNVLSLLGTAAGLHLLAFGDESLQLRFAFKLHDTLNKVFIRQTLKASYFEKELLLDRLYELEEYMKQGLFVVSRFLANYLEFWNSCDHRKHILNLVKWATFSSYEELKERILLPLYDIFITSDVDFMCDIIHALSGLLANMIQVDVYRFERGFSTLFLNSTPGWVAVNETVFSMIKAIEHFIAVSFILYPTSLQLLHESLSFYELLVELELRSSFVAVTIVPSGIVYRSLFSPSTTPFTRVCRLLLRYEDIIQNLEMDSSIKNFERELKLVDLYCADIMNCLWFSKAVSHCETGIVFKEMNETFIRKLNQIVKADSAFSVQSHLMFLPFIVSLMQSECSLSLPQLLTHDCLLTIIETYVPEIAALIKRKMP